MCLLQLIQSWELGSELPYKVTCFLSWSPCATCAHQLAQFLVKNKHVTLRLFASRLYTKESYEDWLRVQKGYEDGLRTLQGHGAHIAIMTSTGQCDLPGWAVGRERPGGSCYGGVDKGGVPGGSLWWPHREG